MRGLHVLCILTFAGLTSASRYSGHRVVTVLPQDEGQLWSLRQIQLRYSEQFDFWRDAATLGSEVMIRAPPEHFQKLQNLLVTHGLSYKLAIPDLQRLIDIQDQSRKPPSGFNIDIRQYNRHADINNWLDTLATECGGRCSVFSIGRSYEGRDMKVIKVIGSGSATKSVVVDAGIHAREWIAPATLIWILNEFVKNYGSNTAIKEVVDRFDWYFLPVANPDGYEYSHTDDRLWRKTRRPSDFDSECIGADPNRNFGHEWGGDGASPDPCSDIYRGDAPFSEPEAANLRDFINGIKANTSGYVTFHSYGNYWLTPWGYTADDPPTYNELLRVGDEAADAIFNVEGTMYTVGSAAQVLYTAAGGSDDWAYANASIPYAFTPELPGEGFGFVLPELFIEPIGEETLEGVIAMARAMRI